MGSRTFGDFFKEHPVALAVGAVCVLLGGIASVVTILQYFENRANGDVAFFCAEKDSREQSKLEYFTIARRANSDWSLIQWESEYFKNSGYKPRTRCREVAPRFQKAYDAGTLQYITNGTMNNQPVICTSTAQGDCRDLLFTLRPWDKPAVVAQQLNDSLNGRSVGTIPQSAGEPQVIIKVDVEEGLTKRDSEEGFTIQRSWSEALLDRLFAPKN